MAIYVDNEKMSVNEVLQLLGLKDQVKIPESKRKRVFEFTRKTPDRLNGGTRIPRSVNAIPQFSVYSEKLGYTVTIRYATSQKRKKDSEPEYSPLYLSMLPDELGFVEINDDFIFLFWYLHPTHELSPFYKSGTPVDYKFLNKDSIAKMEIEREEYLINGLAIIIGDNAWNIFQLRRLAKGLKEPGVDELTDSQVKQVLRNIAHKDPVGFYNSTRVADFMFEGLVQDAVDKKVLELKSLNSLERWYLNGEELLPISYGQDARKELSDFVATRVDVIEKIKNGLAGKTVETAVRDPEVHAAIMGDVQNKPLNPSEKAASNREVERIDENLSRVDTDESFRQKIAEKLKEKLESETTGIPMHHAKVKWFEENADAVKYFSEKYLQEPNTQSA